MKYNNPIISGFNPDPGICCVGENFYLVTSTFEFFPGVPIYHSKNLVNWELINYCLSTDIQLPLHRAKASGGIYAPTLRYHNGTFFMVTTNVSAGGNLIVHTTDIHGKWSDPVWLEQGGIDPSLFWDDNGTCYFVSTISEGENGNGIFLCEINPFTGEMLSPSRRISKGCGGRFAEAPHIYKKDGWYYLMLAEGGTEYGHMETMQRAREIYGPYEKCPRNPILSHRDHPSTLQATGHADLVEDENGNWWAVCLAIRTLPSTKLHHLGRETCLAPVVWDEDGWPIVGNCGKIAFEMDAPLPGPAPTPVSHDFEDRFDSETLNPHWNFVRNPNRACYRLQKGRITLIGAEDSLSTLNGHPTMIALRQQEFSMEAVARLDGVLKDGTRAGISAFYNSDYHYDILLSKEGAETFVSLRKRVADIDVTVARHRIDLAGAIDLKIESCAEWYVFSYENNGTRAELGRGKTALLCSEGTHPTSFTGTFFGVFCEAGEVSATHFTVKEIR